MRRGRQGPRSSGSRSKAGRALVAAAFVKEPALAEGVFQPRPPIASFACAGKIDTEPAIDTIEIHGPYNATSATDSPSRGRRFRVPSGAARRRQRAREPIALDPGSPRVSASGWRQRRRDADALLPGRPREGGFDTGIEWAIERILVDPEFLFRIERPPANLAPGTPYRLSDLELASRLSFFLWSSIPDDELLELATEGG